MIIVEISNLFNVRAFYSEITFLVEEHFKGFHLIESWRPVYNGPSTDSPLSICALYCTIFVNFFLHISLLLPFHVALFLCCTLFMSHLFSCCTAFMWTLFMLYLFRVVHFSCSTCSMSHFFHVELFSCCTVLMLHLFVCFTPFMLRLFSCCLKLHSVHVALFRHSGQQLYQKETPQQVFSCEICEIFKSTYFGEHLQTTASTNFLWNSVNVKVLLSSEAVFQRYSVRKVLLEISQNSQWNTCARAGE